MNNFNESSLNSASLTQLVKKECKKKGFNLVGVTSPHIIENNFLDNWLNDGFNATMHWISRRKEERKNVFKYFPEVKSIISLGYNYYTEENDLDSKELKISNYAWGNDYHITLKNKLDEIIVLIKNQYPNVKYRLCVDTSPVLEKYWANKSGLGWIGKHTNLINDKIGSWFFLCEIMLDIKLKYDEPYSKDLCGTCTKCIDECPTNALDEYILDSNKCISYLTIEHRGNIPKEYENQLDNWIYGCDICQQVCPWNIKFKLKSDDCSFNMRDEFKEKNKKSWNDLTKKEYDKIFKKSAIKRTKYEGLKRNIKLNIK